MTPKPSPNAQKIKANARRSAKSAAKPDPDVAKKALEEAKAMKSGFKKSQKLTPIMDENPHHDDEEIISEFDDPSANTFKDGRR